MDSQEVQSTYQILKLFERSKFQNDLILDSLPGVFAMIDRDGRIMRGNFELANLLNVPHESVLDSTLSELFSEQDWTQFQKKMAELKTPKSNEISFELPLSLEEKVPYTWQIQLLKKEMTHASVDLLSVMGKDISELRRSMEKTLSLSKDLEVTKAVQSFLLPQVLEHSGPQLQMAAFYQSSSQAGGDWWCHETRPDGSVLYLIGDVTGHGAGAAMITALVAGSFMTLQGQSLERKNTLSIETIFKTLNQNIIQICRDQFWMSLTAVEIIPDTHEYHLWNMGGPPTLHVNKEGVVKPILAKSLPLGSSSELEPGYRSGKLKPGESLFLYTDGIYDFDLPASQRFNSKSLASALKRTAGSPAVEIRSEIVKKLDQIKSKAEARDDICFIVLERTAKK